MKKNKVAIIMGSDSDLEIVRPAIEQLKELNIEFEVLIASAHRTPEVVAEFAKTAKQNNFAVIVAAASLAAHTTLPVIGIPVCSGALSGFDSLLSTVQMPPGVPVATVSINGAKNAAILAAQIIALSNSEIDANLQEIKSAMKNSVAEKNKNLKL